MKFDLILELYNTKFHNAWVELLPGGLYRTEFISSSNRPYTIDFDIGDLMDLFSKKELSQLPPELQAKVQTLKPFTLSFADKADFLNSHDITGAGGAASVFGSVISAAKEFLEGHPEVYKRVKNNALFPHDLSFKALKPLIKKGELVPAQAPKANLVVLSAKEPSRRKLYDRLTPYFAKQLNWDLGTIDTKQDRYYLFIRR
jgi:hypothetical protein